MFTLTFHCHHHSHIKLHNIIKKSFLNLRKSQCSRQHFQRYKKIYDRYILFTNILKIYLPVLCKNARGESSSSSSSLRGGKELSCWSIISFGKLKPLIDVTCIVLIRVLFLKKISKKISHGNLMHNYFI